jgi:tetratricopeptide (TPR) repeat protein
MFLASLGELDRAVPEARLAAHLDPYHAFGSAILIFDLAAVNQPDSAIAMQRQLDATSPGFFALESWVADAYREKQQSDSALALELAATKLNGSVPTSGLVVSLAALGRRADAVRAYRQIAANADTTHEFVLYEIVGRAAMAAGFRNEALKWFERAKAAHSDFMLFIRWYPDLKPLRSDPQYRAMLGEMGLPH